MYVIKSVICSLFIFACSSLLAQDKYGAGFYINSKKDTVRGFIKYSDDYSDTFVFKKDLSAGAEKLTIAQSSFYGFDGGNYYSAINFSADQTTANRVYARKLIDGSIDLYAYYNKFLIGSEKRSYFLMTKSKGGNTSDQLARLQGNQGAFNVLFADCLEVAQDAGKNGINEDKLVNLVDRYHACKGLKMVRYLPERRKSVSLSIYAGMTFANLSFNGEEESLNVTAFGTSVNPTLGVMVLLTPAVKHSSIFALQLELLYSSVSFEGSSLIERPFGDYNFRISSTTKVELYRLSPRLGARFSARSNILNPYISVGVTAPSVFASKSKFVRANKINDADEIVVESDEIKISGLSVWVGTGIKKQMKNGDAIFADAVFEFMPVKEKGNITTVTPRIGYIF